MRYLKTMIGLLLSLTAVSSFAAGGSVYSAKSVWKVKPDKFLEILGNCHSNMSCVSATMKKLGASSSAIQFSQAVESSDSGYLEAFKEKGVVDLGTAFYMRANTNNEYVLLNGTPTIVHTEIEKPTNLEKDTVYKQAKKQYPNLEFWGSSAEFQQMTANAKGIQYVFSYYLRDGCHACEAPYSALVQFDFNKQGKYLGNHLFKIVKN